MPARSNLATAEPLRRQLPRTASCPLTGALGGALSGFATTGNPLGACIGRGGFMGRAATTQATTKGDEL